MPSLAEHNFQDQCEMVRSRSYALLKSINGVMRRIWIAADEHNL